MTSALNICNMKIHQGCRKTCMTQPLLHIQERLTVLQQMGGRGMSKVMDGDTMVKTGFCQRVLENCTDIAGLDWLRDHIPAVSLEYVAFIGVVPSVDAEHGQLLLGDGHIAVLHPLALADEKLLTVKTDVLPPELARLTGS